MSVRLIVLLSVCLVLVGLGVWRMLVAADRASAILANQPVRPARYRGTHRSRTRRTETGATVDWSPADEQRDSSEGQLTPTGMLDVQPPATLDDGTVIGTTGLPAWEALSTDTHHAVDSAITVAVARFRAAVDVSALACDARLSALLAEFHQRRDDMGAVEREHRATIARLDMAMA